MGRLRHNKDTDPVPAAAPAASLDGSTTPTTPLRRRDKFWGVFASKPNSRSPSTAPRIPPLPTTPPPLPAPCTPDAGEGDDLTENANNQSAIGDLKADPPLRNSPLDLQPTPNNPPTTPPAALYHADTLWNEAYKKLSAEDKDTLDNPELDKRQLPQHLLDAAVEAHNKCIAGQWKISWGDKEINVRETAEKLIRWIIKFRDIGDIAVQYDPVHAALPWAGVRFILTVVIGEQELLAAAVVGMERIALWIARCAIYEQLYLTETVPEIAKVATTELRNALLALYTSILHVLSRLIKVFKRNILQNLKSLVTIPVEIQELGGPESAVSGAVTVVENCYHSFARVQHKGDFEKLQNILGDLFPVMSALETRTKEMFEDIKEIERITILRWLSTIPYQSHHELACEARVQGTGQWLFQRKEFTHWQESKQSEILWLHGIPGAGKTKLVSATIDMLKGVVDKVSFFYCKRDEEDRRDRHKILLSLVKQLACDGTGIHKALTAAYNEEQKDPSARSTFNVDTTLILLATLLESYQYPIIVLDALDECTNESRGSILKDFLSLIAKSNRIVKVFISSRYSLDIEDRLQGLPYVCIEAEDNAQDIENYVKMELVSRVKDGKLLRGRVSPDLNDSIQQVLITGGKGMFLWVDYQLRELCNLSLERDVRERLGKLPKNLRGVYDEIMHSIQSQPGSNPVFAARALKWMVAARRPLEPTELVIAIEIDPTIPLDSTASKFPNPGQQGSLLEIDDVIHFCRGLIVWDKMLNVLRFAHLSVREYLEEGALSEWNIIDAHLHVAESSLWVLQDSHTLTSIFKTDLYYYIFLTWFRHCRSYQDLVQDSVTGGRTPKHKLDIPLLNSFLGSFDAASGSYVEWHDSLDREDFKYRYEEVSQVLSPEFKPVCPIFVAAFSGLGELVNWLWLSEGLMGSIQNREGWPLLHLVVQSGKRDIVELLLDRGTDINMIGGPHGTTLASAASSGKRDIVELLLDRGADINIIGGPQGTTLASAASSGKRDVVELLLDRGADINIIGGNDSDGTALASAAIIGKRDVVELLLDRGANINVIGGLFGTALASAASRGKRDVVEFLLDQGADINITGGLFGTALASAAYWGVRNVVELLLDRGADINVVGGKYGTALASAASSGKRDVVELLLDRGADINVIGGKYGTALASAAHWGKRDVVELLLDRGADINVIGGKYGTALASAASMGKRDVVEFLLDQGADINTTGGLFGTALASAAYWGMRDVVELLLDRGADIHVIGGKDGTALAAAAKMGKRDVVEFLLNRGAVKPQN